jgi:hypothetical protein
MDKPGVEGGSAEAGEVDCRRDCETVSDASPSSRAAEQMADEQMSRRADEQMSRRADEQMRIRNENENALPFFSFTAQ